jgi:hypothetical protein
LQNSFSLNKRERVCGSGKYFEIEVVNVDLLVREEGHTILGLVVVSEISAILNLFVCFFLTSLSETNPN